MYELSLTVLGLVFDVKSCSSRFGNSLGGSSRMALLTLVSTGMFPMFSATALTLPVIFSVRLLTATHSSEMLLMILVACSLMLDNCWMMLVSTTMFTSDSVPISSFFSSSDSELAAVFERKEGSTCL